MTLLEQWREAAYQKDQNSQEYQKFWASYFQLEKGFYETLLSDDTVITGTIPSLAGRFGVDQMIMVGILDGINDSLKNPNPIDTMDETTELALDYDKEKLYYNMVEARAEWLYTLPEWETLLDKERRAELYKAQKISGTVVKDTKIGRNDPCPCGSGKKYKNCCGR